MSKKLLSRPLIIFYIVAFYIVASFSWWFYLLLDHNNELLKKEQIIFELTEELNGQVSGEMSLNYLEGELEYVKEKRRRNTRMIIGEGSVFLFLLLIGIYQVNKTFRKEIDLARQQHNFLLSITHELKSPLASIKLGIQTLRKRLELAPPMEKVVVNSLEDVDRLQTLVNKMLTATRIDVGDYVYTPQHCMISELILKLGAKLREFYGTNHPIELDVERGLEMEADPEAIVSLVLNLVENAVKYSPAGSEVKVSLKQAKNKLMLSVADHGIGISDEEKAKVFNRFYRVGDEQTRESKGTGIGLYIVKKVVEFHNARITIKDNKPQGSIFNIEFSMTNA